MTPVWLLYLVLRFIGGTSLAEAFDSIFKLSSLGHSYPITFAAANTAAFGSALVVAGHFAVKNLSACWV